MSYDLSDSWDRYMLRHDGYDSDTAHASGVFESWEAVR